MGQLLDNTQVSGDVGTGVNSPLADPDPDEDADEFASPTKARRQGDFNGPQSKSRKKPLPATYEPGTWPVPPLSPRCKPRGSCFSVSSNIHTDKRTSAWLKLKKDYVDGVGDSLDLVPLGAWHGMGRKAAWWSPILLGVWDGQRGKFVAMCKCMSGMSLPVFYFLRSPAVHLPTHHTLRDVRALIQSLVIKVSPMHFTKRSTSGTPLEVRRVRPPRNGM